jgi:hypothetical protein
MNNDIEISSLVPSFPSFSDISAFLLLVLKCVHFGEFITLTTRYQLGYLIFIEWGDDYEKVT